MSVIHQLCKPIPGRFKDYIARPKALAAVFTYSTVWSVCLPLVQIRTQSMDDLAMKGLSAHWSYPADTLIPSSQG